MLNLHLAFLSQGTHAIHSLRGKVKQYEEGNRVKHHHCISLYNKADYIMAMKCSDWLVNHSAQVHEPNSDYDANRGSGLFHCQLFLNNL